jgi:hypothetical protein
VFQLAICWPPTVPGCRKRSIGSAPYVLDSTRSGEWASGAEKFDDAPNRASALPLAELDDRLHVMQRPEVNAEHAVW